MSLHLLLYPPNLGVATAHKPATAASQAQYEQSTEYCQRHILLGIPHVPLQAKVGGPEFGINRAAGALIRQGMVNPPANAPT
jgi:hypothetical protein